MPDRIARAELIPLFTFHMERELEVNGWKGDDWQSRPPLALSHEVLYHAAKLELAIRLRNAEAIREYASDVGNCAAILAARVGVLDEAPPDLPDEHATYEATGIGGSDLKAAVVGWQAELEGFVPGARPPVAGAQDVDPGISEADEHRAEDRHSLLWAPDDPGRDVW